MSAQSKFIEGKVLSGRVYPEFFPFKQTDVVLNVGSGYGPQAIAYGGKFQTMLGIDITLDRLQQSLRLSEHEPMGNYCPIMGNVEQLPFPDDYFDKAIAIDIIEHVQSPIAMVTDLRRVLKLGGQVLITFPTLHDRYTEAISWFARTILRRKSKGTFHDSSAEWHPDHHNQEFSVAEWLAIVEECGFRVIDSRATTLFPPLHLYGVPRFWFSNELIHGIDSQLSHTSVLKNYGQGLMVIFEAV